MATGINMQRQLLWGYPQMVTGSFQWRMFAWRPYRNENSSTRKAPMSYPCIPSWEKTKPRDPFDYKLRSKEEVMKQHEYHQPNFPIIAEWKKYAAGDLREHKADDMMDRRSTVAKIRLDMRDLKLSHL